MTLEFWFAIAIVVLMTVSMVLELLEAAAAVFGALLLFLLSGLISPEEAFRGFSNHGMLAVGFLYIVAYAVESTGLLKTVSGLLLGEDRSGHSRRLLRFLFPVAGASAFMNNTPIVSMLIPMVKTWCRKHGVSPSKILLPLSYATVLGGTCTLIGSSTNLVVHGFLLEHGIPGFGFFELAKVGVPVALVGILFVSIVLHRLLPDRQDVMVQLGASTREFVVELKVTGSYPHLGETVQEAGLRHLQGLFLFQIERDGSVIAPVRPDEMLRLEDRLFFTGVPSTIVELQREVGLEIIEDPEFDLKNYDSNRLKSYEAVISNSSPLIGQSVRQSNFRQYYAAVILAIHRNGQRINRKIGDIVLQPGDTLLLLAPSDFYDRFYHARDFLLISSSREVRSRPRIQSIIILGILAAMVVCVTAGWLPMITASATAAALLILSHCVTPQQGFQAIHWKVLIVIASSFGIARALENAGAAALLGKVLVAAGTPFGALGMVALVALVTMIYSEMVTNSAAALIVFPVMLSVAAQSGVPVKALAFALVFGASTAFATPISYQTNLMVYGPGNYRFRDYLKVGLPLDAIIWVVSVVLIDLLLT